jgi:methyltransferase (TIGR00027 family)
VAEQQSSFTAEAATMFRALESALPEGERVCFDRLAARFLGSVFETASLDEQSVADALRKLMEAGMGPAYAEVVARTRYIDDFLRGCLDDGIEQLVVLGAGFDTRAYRFDALWERGLAVFEVDHPAIQEQKKARVNKALGSLPGHVVYVPLDFGRDDLGEGLRNRGYGAARRTIFIWEGVTMYLAADAVEGTLACVVRNSGPGSSIVFNYVHRSSTEPHQESVEEGAARQVIEHWGESQTFGMDPERVEGFLRDRGFTEVEDVSSEALANLYPALARRGLRVAPYLSLVRAATEKVRRRPDGGRAG